MVVRDPVRYRDYMREYMRDRARRLRAEAVAEHGGVCVDCGTTENLEFDHADPQSKEFNIAKIWSHREEKRRAELAKCVLRCSWCHHQKSAGELRAKIFSCCGRDFQGLQAYRGHKRWCRGSLV